MRAHSKNLGLLSLALLAIGCSAPPSEVTVSTLGPPASTGGQGSTSADPSADDSGTDDGSDSSDDGETNGTGPTFDPVCGDGIIEGDEECDLGSDNGTGEYCTGECLANVCGDGYLGPGEACDDGNANNNDQCTTECGLATCGDGAIQAGEECDNGEGNSETGACLPSCIMATCGDLFIQAGVETCDGVNTQGQSCGSLGYDRGVLACQDDCNSFDTSNCHECGNMVVEPNEVCDPPDFQGVDCSDYAPVGTTVSSGSVTCESMCTSINSSACTFCGDGAAEGPEQCDGADFSGQDCSNFAPMGTTVSGGSLGCNNCAIDSGACTYCGDMVIEGMEQCEGADLGGQDCVSVGADSGTLGCTASCTFDLTNCQDCGNGILEAPEHCDGMDLGGETCASLGAGYRGDVTCSLSCEHVYDGCCVENTFSCSVPSDCCSMNCDGGTCMPM